MEMKLFLLPETSEKPLRCRNRRRHKKPLTNAEKQAAHRHRQKVLVSQLEALREALIQASERGRNPAIFSHLSDHPSEWIPELVRRLETRKLIVAAAGVNKDPHGRWRATFETEGEAETFLRWSGDGARREGPHVWVLGQGRRGLERSLRGWKLCSQEK